ncbi:hypothetical protein BGZ98_002037 [Dissophora globulifera]|nr:hypothetical protein BGZ98_002037 [Dissophora globulifera]
MTESVNRPSISSSYITASNLSNTNNINNTNNTNNTNKSTNNISSNTESTAHKKRPFSTMSPPHAAPWIPSDAALGVDDHARPQKTPRLLSPPEVSVKRPWSNTEQEALYVAVKKHNLFGRWAEVGKLMQLDRSPIDIEQEYMRLYCELSDSDDDEWPSHGHQSTPGRTRPSGFMTPALTNTSISTLSSTHSSQETFTNTHYRRALSHATASEQTHRSPYRKHSVAHSVMDGYHKDESAMDAEHPSPASRLPSPKTSPAAARSRADMAMGEVKPPRTVRVWTLEQSEQLKNLIEDCFPGGYRINWVWVASQMGNTFTRKQCKNKWEIMRRRAGTEDEIVLLKKGHEEFGPSWNKIQEKYLPERSQGGISIMWSLLQTREAEQQQQQQQPAGKRQPLAFAGDTPARHGTSAPSPKSTVSRKEIHSPSDVGRRHTSPPQSTGGPIRRRSSDRDRPYRRQVLSHPIEVEHDGHHHLIQDHNVLELHQHQHQYPDYYPRNDSTSRETSPSSLWKRDRSSVGPSSHPTMHSRERPSSKRFSISSTESFSMSTMQYEGQSSPQSHPQRLHHQQQQQQHLQHYQQQQQEAGSETWTERNRPMTWTEPLTRRLEYIIDQHYPNRQKVNWLKVSALMGSNPIVTKEQCKRRWYLMSQYEHLRSRQGDSLTALVKDPTGDMTMDVDTTVPGLDSRRTSHTESSPTSPMMSHATSDMPSPLSRKRPTEYMAWTEQEVELLKQGVERFGRSWVDIQNHYLKDRSVGSMASKWDYLLLKMRSTTKMDPRQVRSGGHHPNTQLVGEFSEGDMDDDLVGAGRYLPMGANRGEH